MENVLLMLSKTKIFQNICIEDIRSIFPLLDGKTKKFVKDEVAIAEEDEINSIGVVLNGEFSIKKFALDGSQTFIQKAAPPYILGIDVVCTRYRTSPYTVIAEEPSEIFSIPFYVFKKPGTIDENLRLVVLDNILTLISHENMRKLHTMEILGRKGLRERIVTYLVRQKKKNHSSSFTISLNREQLADYLSVNRSALSHELARMQKEGLIEFRKNHFIISDKFKI